MWSAMPQQVRDKARKESKPSGSEIREGCVPTKASSWLCQRESSFVLSSMPEEHEHAL